MSEMEKLTKALLQPEAYPHTPAKVEMAQTYISLLFFAGDYVYKIKKPVDYGYLDFTTLEKRKYYCLRETELNRRLCPSTYQGVMPITRNKDGYKIGGDGKVVEYAVWMKRLPQDRMLDVLLAENKATLEMMVSIAEKLAEFHKKAETTPEIRASGSINEIAKNTGENFWQTVKYVGGIIPRGQYDAITKYTSDFIESNKSLFGKRMKLGMIRDCHGDVHAQHICFYNGIQIFDCIEFNDRFRYCDTASEVAFLAMDLDRFERKDLSRIFVDAYVRESGDEGLYALVDFYKVYRAYVRGKVNCFRLEGLEDQKERDEVVGVAREYFELAYSYIG